MAAPAPHTVGIALGANLGERHANLAAGFRFLDRLDLRGRALRSGLLETDPVDCAPGDPLFLNAVAEIQYAGEPEELLQRLQEFERELGRAPVGDRPVNAPRPLDLDILYVDELVINTPRLIVPHPRMTERRFVLEPLAQIRPELVLPGETKTVAELLAKLPEDG